MLTMIVFFASVEQALSSILMLSHRLSHSQSPVETGRLII
jgi:hypothetical protein